MFLFVEKSLQMKGSPLFLFIGAILGTYNSHRWEWWVSTTIEVCGFPSFIIHLQRAPRERLGGLGGAPWGGSNRIEFPEALNIGRRVGRTLP